MGRAKVEREPSFEYDNHGRIKYNPEIHDNHKKPYTTSELAYICANNGYGKRKDISFYTGRTETTIAAVIYSLRKKGMYEHYKRLGEKTHEQ
jgi:hypothetical protein